MSGHTRRAVIAGLGAATTGGCLSRIGTDPDEGSPSGTSTADRSPTDGGLTRGANEPDPDHSVTLSNEDDVERTVRVIVRRTGTDEVVFDETRSVSPGTDREVYNLERAAPDGVESFAVCGRLVSSTPSTEVTADSGSHDSPDEDCETIETSRCYGDAHVAVQDGGELQVIYSIC